LPCTNRKEVVYGEDPTTFRIHLRTHFGHPPHTPVLDIPEDELARDHLLTCKEHGQIIGSIRYHYVGLLEGHPIHVVDGFCVVPSHRKTGVGDVLLQGLHHYANQRNIPYALFLKEGAPLRFVPSLYTGWYAYRETASSSYKRIRRLSRDQANHVLAVYRLFFPDALWIFPDHSRNQRWMLYESQGGRILQCVQDTYQRKDGQPMAWCSAWIESPMMTDEVRIDAANSMAAAISEEFRWIWVQREWAPDWKEDGAFHWYAYQWKTTLKMDRHAYVMVM